MARILVIDDDDGIRRVVRRILERAGHEVSEAGNGEEGLRLHRDWRPELIVTDIFMPQLDGLETILQLRRDGAAVPIIAISGGDRSGKLDLRTEAALLGAAHTLRKPFEPAALIRCVAGLLAQSGSSDRVDRAPPGMARVDHRGTG